MLRVLFMADLISMNPLPEVTQCLTISLFLTNSFFSNHGRNFAVRGSYSFLCSRSQHSITCESIHGRICHAVTVPDPAVAYGHYANTIPHRAPVVSVRRQQNTTPQVSPPILIIIQKKIRIWSMITVAFFNILFTISITCGRLRTTRGCHCR